MRPVFQRGGTCLCAALASVVECAFEDVIEHREAAYEWFEDVHAWAAGRGWGVRVIDPEDGAPVGYAIAVGPADRAGGANDGEHHAVVVLDGALAHDPFPFGRGLHRVVGYLVMTPPQAFPAPLNDRLAA